MDSKRGRDDLESNKQRAKSKTAIKKEMLRSKTISKLDNNHRGREGGEGNRERAKSRAFSKTTAKKESLRSKTIDSGAIRGKSKSSRKGFANNLYENTIRSSNKIISEIIKHSSQLNLNFTLNSTKFLKFNFQNSKFEKYSEHCLEFTNLSTIPLDKTQEFNKIVKAIKNIPLAKEHTMRIKNDFRSYLKGEKVKPLGGLENIFSKKEEENLTLNFKADKPMFLMFMSIENIKRELNHIKNVQQIADEKQYKAINFVVLLKQGNINSKEYKKMLKKVGIKHDADNIKFFKIANKKNTYTSNFLLLGVENFDEKLSYHNILISKDGKYLKTLDNAHDDIRTELNNLLSKKEVSVNNLKKINLDEIMDEDEKFVAINNSGNNNPIIKKEKIDINQNDIKNIKEFFKGNAEKIRKLNINLEKINFSYFVCYQVFNNKITKFYSSKPKFDITIQNKYSNFLFNLNQFIKNENLNEKIILQHNELNLMQEYLELGIGDWANPNPQSPIPNPQSPTNYLLLIIL